MEGILNVESILDNETSSASPFKEPLSAFDEEKIIGIVSFSKKRVLVLLKVYVKIIEANGKIGIKILKNLGKNMLVGRGMP